LTKTAELCSFFHTSLREYVNSRRESYFPEGQREIALTCLRYLLLKELNIPHVDYNGIRQLVTELSLCYYAATHWGDHVRNWEDNLDKLQLPFSTDIKDLAMTLVQNTRQLEITFLIRKYFETFGDLTEDFDMKSPENVVSGLEVAAGFGINVVFRTARCSLELVCLRIRDRDIMSTLCLSMAHSIA
jgi:hypothetical protein